MNAAAGQPVSAHDVAREIRRRVPGVPKVKLHKLLYYCQGHHLGTFGEPLFTETIAAWDMGPVVSDVWHREKNDRQPPPSQRLTEAQLNTVGYVLSRYGALTGRDLETLSHNQSPWQLADARREAHGSVRIEPDWIREFFAGDVEEYETPLDSDAVRTWLSGAREPTSRPKGDDKDRLAAMREQLLAKVGRA
jgi:uncharacterized phage-associated protein